MKAIKVRELNKYIKKYVAMDYLLSNIDVEGEVSNLTKHSNGNYYLTLKDETSSIRAVVYYTDVENLEYEPFEGDSVIAGGAVAIFEKDASVTFFIRKLRSKGSGNIKEAYERLKEKLEAEGLFVKSDKRLKAFPQKVGVVTSKTGAAIQDIINVIKRRNSAIDIILFPTLVQGDGAVQNIMEGLKYFEHSDVDVVIVGRGGGSYEDLVAFNDEGIARYIHSMSKIVISAVGHEIDYVISDFVADFRAPTPSSAAEIISLSKDELKQHLDLSFNIIKNNILEKIEQNKSNLLQEKIYLFGKCNERCNFERREVNFIKRILNSNIPNINKTKDELNESLISLNKKLDKVYFDKKREWLSLSSILKLDIFKARKNELKLINRYFSNHRIKTCIYDEQYKLNYLKSRIDSIIYSKLRYERKNILNLDLINKKKFLLSSIEYNKKFLDKSKDQVNLRIEAKLNKIKNEVLKNGENLRSTKFSNIYVLDNKGKIITSIKQVKNNQIMSINFKDGTVKSKIFNIEEK
ncbi:exodeoxyribonuclease VII large subunit [Peptoniphilus indolicus]|uniref:Exodeoxyribonuclease 7 large subunit n=2 Tax=Peptoniphilus indolicus TaxID=33030 RepID=A0A379DDQ8_9FIRM|nr:exodeoxyribonuclease VII large subunit [Peptoniphilus indolicus]SUB76047.1 Exodeoxyribonuclease 7 large subunit [Peptoniphilus indolicus]